jgi:hypothetical protein
MHGSIPSASLWMRPGTITRPAATIMYVSAVGSRSRCTAPRTCIRTRRQLIGTFRDSAGVTALLLWQ